MGFFQNPTGQGPNDPYKKYRVEPVGERQTPNTSPENRPPKEKLKFAFYILQLFKKAIDFLIEKHRGKSPFQAPASKSLIALKDSFEILKKEDRSQDIVFLSQLSKTWASLLEESLLFEQLGVENVKLLIQKILNYPQDSSHTFGYYLSECAGQRWIPFPYMELIQKIHQEHEKNPNTSALTDWTFSIDQIILLLKNV